MEVDDKLNCSNCIETECIVLLDCRVHYLCPQCLELVMKDKDIECPLCEPFTATSSCQDSKNSRDFTQCILCTKMVDKEHIQVCKECEGSLCFNCSIQHKANTTKMHTIFPFSSKTKPECSDSEHKRPREAIYFCKKCGKVLCHKCMIASHRPHKICMINDEVEDESKTILEWVERNENQICQIPEFVSMLNLKKEHHEQTVQKLESDLRQRRDEIVKRVNDDYDDQIKTLREMHSKFKDEIVGKIRKLENLQDNFKQIKELTGYYTDKSYNYAILRDYTVFRPVFENEISPENFSAQPRTLTLSKNSTYCNVTESVESLIGIISTVFDEDAASQSEQTCVQASLVYEARYRCIKAVGYDREYKILYILEIRGSHFYMVRIYEDCTPEELRVNIVDKLRSRIHISPLANGEVLLQNRKQFKLISMNSLSYWNMIIPSVNPSLVVAMCASPCKTFLYFYYNESDVYRYDPKTHRFLITPVTLPRETKWMSAHSNRDYIAFSGRFSNIILFSIDQKEVIKIFETSPYSINKYVTFLSETIFIALEYRTGFLQKFHIDKEEIVAKYSHLNGDEIINIGKICSLTAAAENSMFVVASQGCEEHLYNAKI